MLDDFHRGHSYFSSSSGFGFSFESSRNDARRRSEKDSRRLQHLNPIGVCVVIGVYT